MKHTALIVAGNLCQDQEFTSSYDILTYAGWDVHAATDTPEGIRGWQGVNIDKHVQGGYMILDRDLHHDRYDMMVIPGGCKFVEKYRRHPEIIRLIHEFDDANKVIAAICWGPKFLIEAEIVKGHEVLCYESEQTDMRNAGAVYLNKDVAVSENIVTTGHYRHIGEWMRKAIKLAENV